MGRWRLYVYPRFLLLFMGRLNTRSSPRLARASAVVSSVVASQLVVDVKRAGEVLQLFQPKNCAVRPLVVSIIISIPIHPIMPLKLEISYSYPPYPSSCLLSSALSYSPGCCFIGLYCTSALNVVAAGYMVLYADFGEREHVFSPVRRHAFLRPSSVSP
jgi:hypothetical protein